MDLSSSFKVAVPRTLIKNERKKISSQLQSLLTRIRLSTFERSTTHNSSPVSCRTTSSLPPLRTPLLHCRTRRRDKPYQDSKKLAMIEAARPWSRISTLIHSSAVLLFRLHFLTAGPTSQSKMAKSWRCSRRHSHS